MAPDYNIGRLQQSAGPARPHQYMQQHDTSLMGVKTELYKTVLPTPRILIEEIQGSEEQCCGAVTFSAAMAQGKHFEATPAPTLQDIRAIFLNNKSKHKG
jgi:hypothetical protein